MGNDVLKENSINVMSLPIVMFVSSKGSRTFDSFAALQLDSVLTSVGRQCTIVPLATIILAPRLCVDVNTKLQGFQKEAAASKCAKAGSYKKVSCDS